MSDDSEWQQKWHRLYDDYVGCVYELAELTQTLALARSQIMELAEYHYAGEGGQDADGYSMIWQFVGNRLDPILSKHTGGHHE